MKPTRRTFIRSLIRLRSSSSNIKMPVISSPAFLYLISPGKLTDSLPLSDDDPGHHDRQDRPDDHKDPDVDLLVGDAKDGRPVDQHPYAPIENLIHHRCLQF